MNRHNGRHRGWDFSIAYHSTRERADVDVFAPDGRHFAFELAVIDPGACCLGDRLGATVEAWIDGTINLSAAA